MVIVEFDSTVGTLIVELHITSFCSIGIDKSLGTCSVSVIIIFWLLSFIWIVVSASTPLSNSGLSNIWNNFL